MSLFKSLSLRCPSCGTEQSFDAVHSVNADRRPDLRAAIVADDFQRANCVNCAAPLRVDPDFTLLDQAQGLWISAAPLAQLGEWKALEDRAQTTFDDAYGAGASQGAQAIGKDLKPRVTFGWAGLREKLFIADQGLDDVTVELCKLAVLRSGAPMQMQRDTELRLVAVEGDELVFAWLLSSDQSADESMNLNRALYDDIAADAEANWTKLRTAITAGAFVDINRVLIRQPG